MCFRRLLCTSPSVAKQTSVDHTSEWSYVCGPGYPPLMGITIGQGVDRAADLFGDREGLVVTHQNVKRNFTELKEEIDQLAAGFIELGLVPGDRLGIWGPNTHEWYLTQVIQTSKKTNEDLNKQANTPTGASTNPKNFDLNKNLNMNLI